MANAGAVGEAARSRLLGPGVVLIGPAGVVLLGTVRRDERVLVHSVATGREGTEGEVKLRGAARELVDDGRRARLCGSIAAALPFAPEPDRVDAFAVDVESIAHVSWSEAGDQHVAMWPEGRRFVRRITSATSVGPPEEL